MYDTLVIALILILTLTEYLFAVNWNRWYYKNGIRVFSLTSPIISQLNENIDHVEKMVNEELSGLFYGKLRIAKIDENTFAVRESPFITRGSNVMRGILIVDYTANTISISGFLNYYHFVAFIAFLIFLIISTFPFGIIILFAFAMIYLPFVNYQYKKQENRLIKVLRALTSHSN